MLKLLNDTISSSILQGKAYLLICISIESGFPEEGNSVDLCDVMITICQSITSNQWLFHKHMQKNFFLFLTVYTVKWLNTCLSLLSDELKLLLPGFAHKASKTAEISVTWAVVHFQQHSGSFLKLRQDREGQKPLLMLLSNPFHISTFWMSSLHSMTKY